MFLLEYSICVWKGKVNLYGTVNVSACLCVVCDFHLTSIELDQSFKKNIQKQTGVKNRELKNEGRKWNGVGNGEM